METVAKLESRFGGVWNSIQFFGIVPDAEDGARRLENVRFCEAVAHARTRPVILDPLKIECLGARYAFGLGADRIDEMKARLCEERGFSKNYVDKLLEQTPAMEKTPAAVGINLPGAADVLVAWLQPDQAMRLVHVYQIRMEKTLQADITSVISICANVAVRAFVEGEPALSFGCEDSRDLAGIPRDRLAIGLPHGLAKMLVAEAKG